MVICVFHEAHCAVSSVYEKKKAIDQNVNMHLLKLLHNKKHLYAVNHIQLHFWSI